MKIKKLKGGVIRISAKVNGHIRKQSYLGCSSKQAIILFFNQHGYRAALKEV